MDDAFFLFSKINSSNFQKYYFSSSKMKICTFDSEEVFDNVEDWFQVVCERQMDSPVVIVYLGEGVDSARTNIFETWQFDLSLFNLVVNFGGEKSSVMKSANKLNIRDGKTALGSSSRISFCSKTEFSDEILSDWLLYVELKDSQSFSKYIFKYLVWLPLLLAILTLWYFNSEKVFNSNDNWKSFAGKTVDPCPEGVENPVESIKSNLSLFRSHFYKQGYLIESKKTLERWRGVEVDCLNDMVEPWVVQIEKREYEAIEFYRALLLDSLTYPTDLWNRIEGEQRKHDGLDISAPLGTRILSPNDGQVFSWESPRGGKIVAVKNKNEVFWVAHCERILFFSGDSVRKGEAIATVGMTGRTSGPHAHIGTGRFKGFVGEGKIRMSLMDPIEWYHKKIKQ